MIDLSEPVFYLTDEIRNLAFESSAGGRDLKYLAEQIFKEYFKSESSP